MLLRSKKGDIVLSQVILIIIAVAMIFVVMAFGAKLWKAFFPSADKSTEESFNAMYSIINLKSANPLSYDMTPTTLYLGEDYCVMYFYSNTASISYDGTYYNKPSLCKNDKPCICLYEGEISDIQDEKDENVISCKEVLNIMSIDDSLYDFKGPICGEDKPYRNYLIIKNTVDVGGTNTPYLYILDDTTANRAKHTDWSKNRCSNTAGDLCFGKKDQEIVHPMINSPDTSFTNIYDTCKGIDTKYATVEVKCDYDASQNLCRIDCEYGNVADECTPKYKCEDYNKILGVGTEKYITKKEDSVDYKYYYMCEHSDKYCAVQGGCAPNEYQVYAYKNSLTGAIPNGEYSNIITSKNALCSPVTTPIPSGSLELYLTNYDTNNQDCVNHFTTYFFEKMTVQSCRSDRTELCKIYIQNYENNVFDQYDIFAHPDEDKCKLRFNNRGDKYWITNYDASQCQDAMNNNFEPVYKCMAKP